MVVVLVRIGKGKRNPDMGSMWIQNEALTGLGLAKR